MYINSAKVSDVADVDLLISDVVDSDQDLILFERIAASIKKSTILTLGNSPANRNPKRNSPNATVKRH